MTPREEQELLRMVRILVANSRRLSTQEKAYSYPEDDDDKTESVSLDYCDRFVKTHSGEGT